MTTYKEKFYINVYEVDGHRECTCHNSRENALDELANNSFPGHLDPDYIGTILYSDDMFQSDGINMFHLEDEIEDYREDYESSYRAQAREEFYSDKI